MGRNFNCRVFVGERQAVAIAPSVQRLRQVCGMDADMTTDMSWFISRTLLWGNDPVVVLLDLDGQLTAAALFYHRRHRGFPTGVIKGGIRSGDGSVIAPPGLRTEALQAAMAKVLTLPWVHTVLASLRSAEGPDRAAAALQAQAKVNSAWRVREVGTHLSLEGGFEGFLSRQRPRSRRNYRYFRRRAEKELGLVFVPSLTQAEAVQAVEALHGASMFPVPHARAVRLEAAIRSTPGYFAMGVRDMAGQWLSYMSGWRQPDGTYVEWQLNNSKFEAASLSTVMRTYFLEHEASRGVPQIVFVGGTSPALGRYCAPSQCYDALIIRGGLCGFIVKALVTRFCPQTEIALRLRAAAAAPVALRPVDDDGGVKAHSPRLSAGPALTRLHQSELEPVRRREHTSSD